MGDSQGWEALQLEEERLCKTLDALYEVHGCGLKDTAKFLARELGVSNWFKPDVTNAHRRTA